MVDAARHQKQEYEKYMGIKLEILYGSPQTRPSWEARWKVNLSKSPMNMEVSYNPSGACERVEHHIQVG